jgi:hypothetical protein
VTADRRVRLTLVSVVVGVLARGPAIAQRTTWNFDDAPAGRPPSGFMFVGGSEQPSPWVVLRDGTNNVLGLVRPGTRSRLALAEETSFSNVTLSVRARFVDGRRSAGLVWRYRDVDNYYLASLDLRQGEVRVYRVAGGNRTRLGDEGELELDLAAWHTLKVEHRGTRMRLWIDGVPVKDARDRNTETAGAIGLWAAEDSVVWFDDLTVAPAEEERQRSRRN